jgi:hypothetical protein
MKKLMFAAIAAAGLTLGVAAPASAQVGVGVGPGGAGVQVGPFGAGVGPAYDNWGYGHRRYHEPYGAYNYAGDCRVVRERITTPSGRLITRTHRVCD